VVVVINEISLTSFLFKCLAVAFMNISGLELEVGTKHGGSDGDFVPTSNSSPLIFINATARHLKENLITTRFR